MNPIQTIPVKTWQFFNACKRHLGLKFLTNHFKVGPRQYDRWSCDPEFADSAQRNPQDRLEALYKKMMDIGQKDIARAGVDRFVRIVECGMYVNQPQSDKDSIDEELLDNLPALAAYQEAVTSKAPIGEIRAKAMELIQEIHEDLSLIQSQAKED